MANEYYGDASTPTSDFLVHYGVKGMKWGVRKAIERGNQKAFSRHYARAKKKLDRLESKANIETQNRRLKRNKRIAGVGLGVGLTGGVSALNQHLKIGHLKQKVIDTDAVLKKARDAYDVHNYETRKAFMDAIDDSHRAYDELKYRGPKIETAKIVSAGIGAAGIGTAAVAGGRAALAKYRTTKKGHAKAVQKADVFRKEFNTAFNSPEAKKMAKTVKSQIAKANNRSLARKNKETIANDKFVRKRVAKQAKKRARLERKIGTIS